MYDYSIQENIVNISMKAAELLLSGKIQADDMENGHAGMTQTIVQLAKEFEKLHEDEDWNLPFSPDYWEEIDRFAEQKLTERYGIELETPENMVSLWARVGMTLKVPQTTYERLKAGDRNALQDVFDGKAGEAVLDGETYFPDIDQNVGLKEMEFDLPVSKAHQPVIPERAIPNNDPVKVYAVSGSVKREIYSGSFSECKGFCNASDWSYIDENRFEWALELEDTRDLPNGYFKAIAHFSREAEVDMDNDHTREHAEELVYCFENQKSLLDYDCWTHYESILGDKLSFQEYIYVDSRLNEDPLELTPQDLDIIGELKMTLFVYRNRQWQSADVSHGGSLGAKIQDAQNRQTQQDKPSVPSKDQER